MVAETRERLALEFPDGARLAPYAEGAIAVPLRSGAEVVGSMGFPFAEPGAIDAEVIALAMLAADLGGQALERAGLYEQERRSREALDSISRLAPRFGAESPEAVLRAVCREATETFESDIAQIWTIDGDAFRVLWREPESELLPPGTRVLIDDFPGLAQSILRLETLFIEDSLIDVRGSALEHARAVRRCARRCASRSRSAEASNACSCCSGRASSRSRRRRRSSSPAGSPTRRGSHSVTPNAALRRLPLRGTPRRRGACSTSRARSLRRSSPSRSRRPLCGRRSAASARRPAPSSGSTARRSSSSSFAAGYPAATLDGWRRFELGADLPLSDAVRRNTIVALETPDERARRYPRMSIRVSACGVALASARCRRTRRRRARAVVRLGAHVHRRRSRVRARALASGRPGAGALDPPRDRAHGADARRADGERPRAAPRARHVAR